MPRSTVDDEIRVEQQQDRARALVEMLDAASKAGLPLMKWLVNSASGSCLHGETDWPLDPDPRGTFDAWVRFLGARAGAAYRLNGVEYRRASGSCPQRPNIDVGLLCIANVYGAEDGDRTGG